MQYGNISSWGFVGLYVNSSLNTHKHVGISDSFSTQVYIFKRSSFSFLFLWKIPVLHRDWQVSGNLINFHTCSMPVELWQLLYRSNMKSTAYGKRHFKPLENSQIKTGLLGITWSHGCKSCFTVQVLSLCLLLLSHQKYFRRFAKIL